MALSAPSLDDKIITAANEEVLEKGWASDKSKDELFGHSLKPLFDDTSSLHLTPKVTPI